MSLKIIPQAGKSVESSVRLPPSPIVPATNDQAHLVSMRVDKLLEPDDDALQEDLAATPGDGIETGAGQGGQVLLAQVPPAATPPAGAPPVSSGAAAAGAVGAATIPTALLVLGGLGLVAAAAGGGGDAPASAGPDTTAPTVSITDNVTGTANGPVTFTFTFSEPVTGFVATDIVVTGGTPGTFTAVSGSVYTLVVTPAPNTQAGAITVNVAAGVALDAANNLSTVAVQATQAYDTAAPTVDITDNVAGTANGPVTFTFTFSENVTGFTVADVAVLGGTLGAFNALSGSVYILEVIPTPNTLVGTITVNVAANAAIDSAGNNSTAAVTATQAYDTQTPDTTPPTVTITDNVAAATTNGPVTFTFAFSENVTGFTLADVAVLGGTAGALTTVSASVYTLVVTPTANTQAGAITVNVAAGVAFDTAATPNGNTVAAQATQAYDTLAPTVSSVAITSATGIQGSLLNAGDVVSTTVTISEAATVTGAPQLALNIGGTTVQAGYASGSGTTALVFTYTILAGQTDANGISIAANSLALNGGTITDTAGNAATLAHTLVADNINFQVDTTAPTVALTAATDDVGTVTGALLSGATTDDTALLLSGTNEAGATVQVYNGATLLGAATVSGTTWSYTATVADGTTYQFNARATDAAGNISAATANFTVIGDTTAPAAPVISMVAGNDIINAAEAGSAISGTAEANATVNLTLGVGNIRTVTANGAGAWTYTLVAADITVMGQGAETLSATATDAAGNVSVAGTRPISIDTVAPTAPVIDVVAVDNIINIAEAGSAISGTAEANATVNLTLGTGNVRTVTASGAGAWTYTLVAADITAMGQGAETLSATATDAAGNVSVAGTRAISIDTLAPTATAAITAVADNVAPVTGNLTSGGATNDTSLALSGTITGTLGAGEVVAVYDGATRLGTAAVSGAAWTFTDSTLVDGDAVSYTVRVEDAAGNQGTASTAFTTTIDTLAPTATAAITAVTDNFGLNTGDVPNGGATDDTSLDLSGTNTALGAGEVVAVYDGATRLGNATQATGTTWSFLDTTLVNGDAVSYTVRVEDAAGNQGAASTPARTATISAPTATAAITAVADDVAPVTGNLTTGGATNDTSLVLSGTITGTLNAGELVAVYDGLIKLGNATQPTSTTWSYTDSSLVNGNAVSYTVRVENAAGDQGTASTAFTTTIDTAAPAAPVINAVAGDDIINAAEAGGAITGTAEANATVNLTLGVGNVRTVTANGAGAWTYTLVAADITAMGQGAETLSATATDAAGNVSVAGTRPISIDTVAPTAPVISVVAVDDIINIAEAGSAISGTAEANATVNLTLGVGNVRTVTANGAGAWTYTLVAADITAMGQGAETLSATATDAAGNVSVAGTRAISIDTLAPTVAITDDEPAVTANIAGGNVIYTFTFSEAVTGFDTTDVVVTGGTKGTFAGSGASYTLAVTPTANTQAGTITVNVAASAAIDTAGNVSTAAVQSTQAYDTARPSPAATGFVGGTSVITMDFSEVVVTAGIGDMSLVKNPISANNFLGTAVTLNSVTGSGTGTLTLTTDTTQIDTDVVRIRFDQNSNDVADLAGNKVSSREFYVGGVGDNTIDLSNYGSSYLQVLRGNAGADTLIGTNAGDILIDGSGLDTLSGRRGADIIRLVETLASGAQFSDIVKIKLGESTVNAMDVIGGSTTVAGTGFDISSATPANHDVLRLGSNVIAANVTNADGTDVGALATHSIAGGIVTFGTTVNTPILIDTANLSDALAYLSANITGAGAAVAFRVDTDNSGTIVSGVDALYVFQNNGTIPLSGNFVVPDTVVKLDQLIGLTSATLSTAPGANVVQLQDTSAPEPIGIALTSNGIALNFAENAFATTSIALSLKLNGSGTDMVITSVTGSGSTAMAFNTGTTFGATEWVLLNYAGTNVTNGLSDVVGNFLAADAGDSPSAFGSSGNNTIDLSNATNFPATGGYDINGFAGNDILTGSAAAAAGAGDYIDGGTGADLMTGGLGRDNFSFEQGDSPVGVVNLANGTPGILDNGDTFAFVSGVDRITDLASGEGLNLNIVQQEFANAPGLGWMGTQAETPATSLLPSDGLATNQGFFMVRGGYNTGTGVFTVDSAAGADTLVIYDGDSSALVTQTGIVLSGVTLAQLNAFSGSNFLSHI